jgi:hypothetical protein
MTTTFAKIGISTFIAGCVQLILRGLHSGKAGGGGDGGGDGGGIHDLISLVN